MNTIIAVLLGVYLAMYPLGLWIASRVDAQAPKAPKASVVRRFRKLPYGDSDAA
jgi:hypothetical protein